MMFEYQNIILLLLIVLNIACIKAQSSQSLAELQEKINLWSKTENCPCVPYEECSWVKNNPSDNLPRKLRRAWIRFFRSRRCDNVDKGVSCCGENASIQDLGTWKPDGTQGECGVSIDVINVVGGNVAKLGEFPYMALIGYTGPKGKVGYLCGASVINKWYILTAAHCVQGNETWSGVPTEIVLGEHTLLNNPDCSRGHCAAPIFKRKPIEVIRHEKYDSRNPTSPYDVALIRVDEIMPLYHEDKTKSAVIPVCLPWKSNDPGRKLRLGDTLIVTGWGKVTNNVFSNFKRYQKFSASSRQLRTAKLNGVPRVECEKQELYKGKIDTAVQLCAGGDIGVDSCGGDSGGPLVHRTIADSPFYQVGIVSYGTKICGAGIPGVYTRLSSFLDWIESKLKE